MVWDGLGWSDGKGGTLGALNTALTLSPLCFQLALEGRVSLLLVKVMEDIVEHEVVAVLVLSQVFDQLGAMAPHSLHSLEHVDFTVLDDLLNAGVCCTVDATP